MKVVALLDSMWGWRGFTDAGDQAPPFFRIHPDNHSGRRLYKICGPDTNLLVTNSCLVVQESANHHGLPDYRWVRKNLIKASADGCDLFLICGKVAQATYDTTGLAYPNVIRMMHPAARTWTKGLIEKTRIEVESWRLRSIPSNRRADIE